MPTESEPGAEQSPESMWGDYDQNLGRLTEKMEALASAQPPPSERAMEAFHALQAATEDEERLQHLGVLKAEFNDYDPLEEMLHHDAAGAITSMMMVLKK